MRSYKKTTMKLHRNIFVISSFMVFVLRLVPSIAFLIFERCYNCSLDIECSCFKDTKASCRGMTSIPQCLPNNTTTLNIFDAQNLRTILQNDFQRYPDIKSLSLSKVGITKLRRHYFRCLPELRTLKIKSASNLSSIDLYSFYTLYQLERIEITGCANLKKVQNDLSVNQAKLEILDLSGNGIEIVEENAFIRSTNLSYLSLSNNRMKYLPRKVFENLTNLRNLDLSNCQLQEIYPEHVNSSFQSGSLIQFVANENPWQCESMCEFITWMHENDNFKNIARLGECASPNNLKGKRLERLSRREVCENSTIKVTSIEYNIPLPVKTSSTTTERDHLNQPEADSSLSAAGILFFGLALMSIFAVVCCFVIATKDCLVRKCCYRTNSTSPASPRPELSGIDNEIMRPSMANNFQSYRDVGNCDNENTPPPSYEEATGEAAERADTDSLSGIEPPPYKP